jgi:hypothetical protein
MAEAFGLLFLSSYNGKAGRKKVPPENADAYAPK